MPLGFLKRILGRKSEPKPRKAPSKEDFFQLIPVRNPVAEWDSYPDGSVYIVLRKGGGVRKEKRLNLDEIGSFVWMSIDSKTSVEDILGRICRKYKLSRVEAETPLLMFLRKLSEKNLIAFLPKEALTVGRRRRGGGGGLSKESS